MAGNTKKFSDLQQTSEIHPLNSTSVMPGDEARTRLMEISAEIDGIFQSTLLDREREVVMHGVIKRTSDITSDAWAGGNKVKLDTFWVFGDYRTIRILHTKDNEGESSFRIKIEQVGQGGTIYLRVAKDMKSEKVTRELVLTPSSISGNGTKLVFTIDEAWNITPSVEGTDQQLASDEIQRSFNVESRKILSDEIFAKEWYSHFREQLFGIK